MIKHALYRALSLASASLAAAPPASGLRVLLYHAVGTKLAEDPYGISMDAGMFERHVEYLASVRGDRWEAAPFGPPSAERREFAVVFDDGFADTLSTAAPLLVARGLPFTVFVTPGFIRQRSPAHLTPIQLRELAALPGVLIGAHGDTHVRLDTADDALLRRELDESRRYLEDAIGKPVTTLSYPHGAVDRRVAAAAKAAGYAFGGTSRYGLNAPGRDPLLLCRTEVTAWDTALDLRLKLEGHWDWYRLRRADPAG